MGKCYQKNLKIFIFSIIAFVILQIPFQKFFSVFEFSEVRPVVALNTSLAIIYGPMAILGCTIGNFITDTIAGYSIKIKIWGSILQMLFCFTTYFLFDKLNKNDIKKFIFDTYTKFIKYVITIVVA